MRTYYIELHDGDEHLVLVDPGCIQAMHEDDGGTILFLAHGHLPQLRVREDLDTVRRRVERALTERFGLLYRDLLELPR